jgi:hypothetical protein
MRRIPMSLSVAAIFLIFACIAVPAKLPRKAANAASKTRATAEYGNADSISEEELKIYDYFLAADQLAGRNLRRPATTQRHCTWRLTWQSGVSSPGEAQARRTALFSRISCLLC